MISENLKSLMSWAEVFEPTHVCDACGNLDTDAPEQWLDCYEIAEMYNISVQSVRVGGQRGCMGETLKLPTTNKIGRAITQSTNHYRIDRVKAWREPLIPKK